MIEKKAWISTYGGRKFFLLHPRLKDIYIEDIAHSLSLQSRWTGHCKYHFSVAQHSYYCSLIVDKEYRLEALLHDSSEAYISDISRPLKYYTLVGTAYQAVERILEHAIRVKFDLPLIQSPAVKVADNAMLYAEKKQIMNNRHKWREWEKEKPADIKIKRWSCEKAERMFLSRFRELTRESR